MQYLTYSFDQAKIQRMEIHLENQQEAYVRAAVASGRFSSPDDAVNDVLRQAQDHEAKLAVLRNDIQIGIDSSANGKSLSLKELKAYAEYVKSRGMEKCRQTSSRPLDEK